MSRQSGIHNLARFMTILLLAASLPLWAGNKKAPANVIDSGIFDIMIGGKKVATETFQISQETDFSVAKGTLKTEDGSKESQTTNWSCCLRKPAQV